MTKAAPILAGRCLRRSVTAARPPAEAPTPTTGNDAGSAAPATFSERLDVGLRGRVASTLPVDLRRDVFMPRDSTYQSLASWTGWDLRNKRVDLFLSDRFG